MAVTRRSALHHGGCKVSADEGVWTPASLLAGKLCRGGAGSASDDRALTRWLYRARQLCEAKMALLPAVRRYGRLTPRATGTAVLEATGLQHRFRRHLHY